MSLFIYGRLSSARFVIGALHGVRSALTEEGVREGRNGVSIPSQYPRR